VALPAVGAGLHAEFWAVAIALPAGKIVGIVAAGLLGARFVAPDSWVRREPIDLLMVGCLGGVGFTVALLMNELAFRGSPSIADEGVLAVLAGSALAIAYSAVFVALRSRHHRRPAELRAQQIE
jgi:NhaA family Na+:H+ antiporter